MSENRDQWGSSLGFVLAAVGSAVGLGNLWKFPYIAWDNSGGAFVIVYLFCILLIGMPIMMAEILIGRRTQSNPVPAFERLGAASRGGKKWALVGWLGVVSGMTILSFYAVIAGWSLSSFVQCIQWSASGYPEGGADFGAFIANTPLQLLLTFLFSAMTAGIVMRGVSGGIEKATKILMPVLFAIMTLLVLNSVRMDGFGQALSFLFSPDFSKITTHGVLEALGHAFFTLSLGMGAMITYGSYIGKSQSINSASAAIVIMDTVIAIMACIIMYTILFTFPEIQESLGRSSVGMLFVTLPQMFYTKMAGGVILGPVFYILVGFAALSSTISLLEVVVSMLVDKLNLSRVKATLAASGSIFTLSLLCALSLNPEMSFFANFKLFGQADSGFMHQLNDIFFANKAGFLNAFDHLSANWFLPVGGFFITIFTGWFLDKNVISEELDLPQDSMLFKLYLVSIRFIAPAAIGFIIFKILTGADFT